MSIDLESLPPPSAIETLSFEQILSELLAELVELFPEIEPVLQLESSIVNKLMQVFAYREVLVRGRVNDAFKQTLLAFANKSNLDHLAYFYDVFRMSGETDDRFLLRIILSIQGRSPGGTTPRYKAIAMGASLRVAAAEVYRNGYDPTVYVAIYSTDPGGVADAALVAQVQATLNDPFVRLVNDTIVVHAAVFETVDLVLDVWLLPDADGSRIQTIESSLRAAWTAETGLGFDLARPWIVARAMVAGVQSVDVVSPAADVVAAPFEALSLGAITINDRGRKY